MSRILRIYVIKEVVFPTLLTLMTILFVMLMGQLYKLITFLMQPSVSLAKFAEALFSFIPFLMILAVPMAILIGALIGVGRMTLDREILASRASGINLFRIFAPMIFMGLLISLGIMAMSRRVVPDLLQNGVNRIIEMQYAVVSSLEPGQFYGPEDLAGFNGFNFLVCFRERDPKNPLIMKGITLKLEDKSASAKKEADTTDKNEKRVAVTKGGGAPVRKASVLDNIVSSATMHDVGTLAPAATPPAKVGVADDDSSPSFRHWGLTLITAESGSIVESGNKSSKRTTMLMNLNNGVIHRLNPEAKDRQYLVIRFDSLEKRFFGPNEMKKKERTMTNDELTSSILYYDDAIKRIQGRGKEKLKGPDKDKLKDAIHDRGKARRELLQRYTLPLASFVFILIGIPLAIWVRPSGKSWGILMAVALMLIYYVIMNAGLGMVEYDRKFGYFVSFLPNLLFLALGAGLWWQSVRS